jgi:hypothetical protein
MRPASKRSLQRARSTRTADLQGVSPARRAGVGSGQHQRAALSGPIRRQRSPGCVQGLLSLFLASLAPRQRSSLLAYPAARSPRRWRNERTRFQRHHRRSAVRSGRGSPFAIGPRSQKSHVRRSMAIPVEGERHGQGSAGAACGTAPPPACWYHACHPGNALPTRIIKPSRRHIGVSRQIRQKRRLPRCRDLISD